MARLILHFRSAVEGISLERTEFHGLGRCAPLIATRGGTPDSNSDGTFAWTQAVKALCALFVRYKAAHCEASAQHNNCDAALSGERGTLAASLDSAISKTTQWLVDVFGSDSEGVANIRRLVKRINPERKRPGPVIIRVNSSAISSSDTIIILDYRQLESQAEILELLKVLECREEVHARDAYLEHSSQRLPLPVDTGTAISDSALRFAVSTDIRVSSFIPFYHGCRLSSVARVERRRLTTGEDAEVHLFGDGYGVAHVRNTYSCSSVPDFLWQRRVKHLAFIGLEALFGEQRLALHTRARDLVLPQPSKAVSYVMSIHYLKDLDGTVPEVQRICMAEPSIIGITDDPDVHVPESGEGFDVGPLHDRVSLASSVEKLSFGTVSYYASWANVLAVLTKTQVEQPLILETLQIELQHLWFKIYNCLETVGRLIPRITRLAEPDMEKWARHFEEIQVQYHNFRMIRPTAPTDVVALRKCLVSTSKIDLLFEELTRHFQVDARGENRTQEYKKAWGI